jgi:hypothetical protein
MVGSGTSIRHRISMAGLAYRALGRPEVLRNTTLPVQLAATDETARAHG